MKRIVFLLSVGLMTVILLTSCIEPESYTFKYNSLKERVTLIELIDYDNPNPTRVSEQSEMLPFDFEKMTVIETLDSEKIDDFLKKFSKNYVIYDQYPSEALGISIKINFDNGDFVVLSEKLIGRELYLFIARFNSEGNIVEYCGGFGGRYEFSNLVNTFFETKVECEW